MSELEKPKVGRAAYMREYRARQKALASGMSPGTRLLIGYPDDFYLARIAELEEEVQKLKAELAKLAATVSSDGRADLSEPPSFVTADGTRGMQRGVSVDQSRPARTRRRER